MPEPAGTSAFRRPLKILLFANTEWYLFNFRLALAKGARAQGAEVVLVSPPGPYGEKLRAEGFRWIPVPMARRSLNPIREVFLLWVLWRLYRREKPDIAHHFTIKCVVYGGLAAKGAGARGVVSAVAGMGYVFGSRELLARMLRPLVRRLLGFAMSGRKSRLIVQNPDDQRAVIDAGLMDPSDVRLIAGSGVDTQRYHPRPDALCASDRTPSVVFAARLLWAKGVTEFAQAAQVLRAEGLKIQFLVAGEPDAGNPASVPEKQLTAWREEGNVTLLGHVQDMPALMATADVVVLPTSYREGVPRSLIEAAAAGLPIVTTDAPGCREVVEDGVNGILVPVRDGAALAAAIRKLVLDPALAARMGAASRQKALAQFDERIVLANTLAVYRELVPEWRSFHESEDF
ncbi:MAG: glycosyltransferase family 4 protein [Gemmatimonadaceae bacterium]